MRARQQARERNANDDAVRNDDDRLAERDRAASSCKIGTTRASNVVVRFAPFVGVVEITGNPPCLARGINRPTVVPGKPAQTRRCGARGAPRIDIGTSPQAWPIGNAVSTALRIAEL